MIIYHISACIVAVLSAVVIAELPNPLSDEFINLINSKNATWKAGRNFASDVSYGYLKNLVGALKDPYITELPCQFHPPEVINDLPDFFNPVDKWPYCPTLYDIRDQGSCQSCWAFAAVEVMSDRVCINSKGTKYFYFSADDLLSCCKNCGHGCGGGFASRAWKYWVENGLVSGGAYNSSQGCRPYEVPPCEHKVSGNRPPCHYSRKKILCRPSCEDYYDKNYSNDKHKGKNYYRICNKNEEQIKADIYLRGPVETTFTVYSDFFTYQSGVYHYVEGKKEGVHSVKIMGWGVMNNIKYWLVANSWNSDWGAMGFFKIRRGTNECGIENEIVAGEPGPI